MQSHAHQVLQLKQCAVGGADPIVLEYDEQHLAPRDQLSGLGLSVLHQVDPVAQVSLSYSRDRRGELGVERGEAFTVLQFFKRNVDPFDL